MRCISRNPARLFIFEPGEGLLRCRVNLNRQRSINSQNLKQEREPIARAVRAQKTVRMRRHQLVQRRHRPIDRSFRRSRRMRPHPNLSLRLFRGYGHTAHATQNFVRTPRIILNLILQRKNFAHVALAFLRTFTRNITKTTAYVI